MKTRLQALRLLDRAIAAASDDELDALIAALSDDHREAVERMTEGTASAGAVREVITTSGRINGTLESLAMVLTDACLADCIEALGTHADNPSTAQLQEVLPDLIDQHGVAAIRVMLASTIAGDAPASAIIRDLLKNDDVVKLPPAEERSIAPVPAPTAEEDADRDAIRAKRKEQRKEKQLAERARREQAARARNRA